MDLTVVGINHTTAPVEIREMVSFSPEEVKRALIRIREEAAVRESMILSTCNRTEFYIGFSNITDVQRHAVRLISQEKGIDFSPEDDHFYSLTALDGVGHLFRVAAGLDSMMVGEAQILGQVKDAYRLACECATTGVLLNRLLHAAFRVGKRVRSETKIGMGSVSVSYAAVELAQNIFNDLTQRTVLLVGAGKMGKLTAKHLKDRGVRSLLITNRTPTRGEELADELGGQAIPWQTFKEKMKDVDVIISTTGSKETIVSSEDMKAILGRRAKRPMFIIDIAVPRDFDPEIGHLKNVLLYNVDDLQSIVDQNLEKRRCEIPKAEAIVNEEVEGFKSWYRSLNVAPLIKSLYQKFDWVRQQEVERNRKRFLREDWDQLELLTQSIVQKLLHIPISKLKEYNSDPYTGLTRIETIQEVFDLKDEPY
ncbi:MAG: glutamyl-tRNA reductase [bacterium]